MEYDEKKSRLTIKLVYYGPAQSGKTSNLMRLHDIIVSEHRGDLMTLKTKNDRTLFFDLLPVGFTAPSGLLVKFKLFTVPGQVAHDGTRKAVLSRADGVVFVADSQTNQAINNGESFQNLADNAVRVGLDFEKLPLVVQYNKRDLPNIVSEDEIRRRWQETGWPLTFSSAATGDGVIDTFRVLLLKVHPQMERLCGLASRHGINEDMFVNAACTDCSSQRD